MSENIKINKQALVVMARVPEVGKVKTRLTAALGESGAFELYKCLLKDLLFRIATLNNKDIFIFHTPDKITEELTSIIPDNMHLTPQEGNDLGERMFNAIENLLDDGYKSVVVIGSDSPDIPLDSIEEGFLKLEGDESFVIGPSTDGGYYLIGANCPIYTPFENINWGTDGVFESTISNLQKAGINYELLGEWHDIDTEEDLELLKNNEDTPESSNFLKNISK